MITMSDKDITDAIIRIFKKELGAFSDVFPDDLLKDIKKRISPAINDLFLVYCFERHRSLLRNQRIYRF